MITSHETTLVLGGTGRTGKLMARGLAERGFAVRRGETFPGLGPTWLRVAVRDPETSAAFVAALADLAGGRVPEPAQQKGLR